MRILRWLQYNEPLAIKQHEDAAAEKAYKQRKSFRPYLSESILNGMSSTRSLLTPLARLSLCESLVTLGTASGLDHS